MHRTTLSLALFGVLLAGCAETHAVPVPKTEASAPTPRLHRLAYTLVVDDGGARTERTYTLGLEERRGGEVRAGANVSLAPTPGSGPRMDTGVLLRSSYVMNGDALALHVDFESSHADEARTIRKVSSHSDMVLVAGTPAVLLRARDPIGNVDYTLSVVATKVR